MLATPGNSRPRAPKLAEAAALPRAQVIVVALDGARFQEVFEGVDPDLARQQGGLPPASAQQLMPHLHGLMTDSGAALGAPGHGAPISASGPDFVSLPGYSEIFSGRRVTGCANNYCKGISAPSIADELAQAPRGLRSAVVTSWPAIARVAATSARVAVSAGRHGGDTHDRFERDERVRSALHRAEPEAPWPGNADFRRDRFTAAVALAYLEAEEPDFMFVGLGETDEFAHQGSYTGYLDALRAADQYIGALAEALSKRAARGVRTALFVTADHGRAASFRDHGQPFPESARVWLVAAGSAIEARGLLASPTQRHLADIAPTLRSLFGLPADRDGNAGAPLLELLGLTQPAGG
ncbi:MAG TPA: alkaline phosphatase family protein [Polyangiaceae bacterium]|nr:alkaline phosphatase family protein [Polyangiaceae bacterium]